LIREELKSFIKVNDVVSYYFKHISSAGKLIKPEIYKLRKDLTWASVLENQQLQRKQAKGELEFVSLIYHLFVIFRFTAENCKQMEGSKTTEKILR
jgi:hypothetical protein